MDRRALGKAESRLRIAKKAVADLQASQTYGDFSDHWYVFLTSAKNVYTVLEQGSKTSPQSRQWFGAKKQVRKNDPLLQYLYEARNDDEHGLGSSVELAPERHEIGVARSGHSNAVRLEGETFQNVVVSGCATAVVFEGAPPAPDLSVTSLDDKPILIKRTPATAVLVEITARGNRKYPPPKSHLGNTLTEPSPLSIAQLAVSYLEVLVREASHLA